MADFKPTAHELRILQYLDQRGPMHRSGIVRDLAGPNSKMAKGFSGGSNGFVPAIMANWSKRIAKAGLIRRVDDRRGFYCHHEITEAGRKFIRSTPAPSTREVGAASLSTGRTSDE